MIIFKNIYLFTALFFIVLFTDIYIKVNVQVFPYRFITKGFISLLLIGFYLANNHEVVKNKFRFMLAALVFFLLGDQLLILYEVQLIYIFGIFCFILGKTFYVFRFSNQHDFKLTRLLPFLLLCFFYMLGILTLTYDNLGAFFYPVLIYLFIAMIVVLFALLRKNEVSSMSYKFVLIGIAFSVLSDSISVLQTFYDESMAYHNITIMLFYGLSQYFIVTGIIIETKGQFKEITSRVTR